MNICILESKNYKHLSHKHADLDKTMLVVFLDHRSSLDKKNSVEIANKIVKYDHGLQKLDVYISCWKVSPV